MLRGSKKLAVVATFATALVTMLSTAAVAGIDSGDQINPASTNFTATNSGNVTFKGTIDFISVTVTCKSSSISGKTPPAGSASITISPPSFSNCTDSLGGTDTVKTNATNGSWSMTFVDSPSETGTEPNSGDGISLTIPKAGATFSSSALSSCTLTAAPSGQATINSSYNDSNTAAFSNQSVPTSGSGCFSSSSATFNGTYVTSITISDTA